MTNIVLSTVSKLEMKFGFTLGDQGIKFCSKIQSAQNHFKSNESVGLVVANPMQLVWVQTDVGSERYRVLFKMANRQKRDADCTVRTVRTNDDVADHMMMWQAIR
jgi:hypothetical protein